MLVDWCQNWFVGGTGLIGQFEPVMHVDNLYEEP